MTEVKSTIKRTNKAKTNTSRSERYFEAVGRRKTAVARIRLFSKKTTFEVNGKTLDDYFGVLRLRRRALEPLEKMKLLGRLGAVVKVVGGGITGQADAVRLALARALIKFNPEFKKRLRRLGFLTRDARVVERKKYGLKKARRATQWRKR
jgi:small subunit ribosomal protein S9